MASLSSRIIFYPALTITIFGTINGKSTQGLGREEGRMVGEPIFGFTLLTGLRMKTELLQKNYWIITVPNSKRTDMKDCGNREREMDLGRFITWTVPDMLDHG